MYSRPSPPIFFEGKGGCTQAIMSVYQWIWGTRRITFKLLLVKIVLHFVAYDGK